MFDDPKDAAAFVTTIISEEQKRVIEQGAETIVRCKDVESIKEMLLTVCGLGIFSGIETIIDMFQQNQLIPLITSKNLDEVIEKVREFKRKEKTGATA